MSKNLKIKSQYKRSEKITWERSGVEISYLVYDNIKSQCHKSFSTKQEKSFFCMHKVEYKEYNLKLRMKRSSNNLADPWDDYPSYVTKNGKSWKSGTKRRKQYKGI